jgi:hypothetical protein
MLPRAAAIAVLLAGCAHQPARKDSAAAPATAAPTSSTVEFARDVRPLLQSRCQPCHFAGGQMYDRLPFDHPETVRQLGAKLFTRIKDEGARATIRRFLDQGR